MSTLAAFAARNAQRQPTTFAAKAAILAAVDRLIELSQRADRGEYGLKGSVERAYTDDREMVEAAFASLNNALNDLAEAVGGERGDDLFDAEDALTARFWANCSKVEDAGPNDLAEIGAVSRIGGVF